MKNLDLTFLATGAAQHVFTATECSDDWVYKIPCSFGYILPFKHRSNKLRSDRKFETVLLKRLLIKAPRYLSRKLCDKQNIYNNERESKNFGVFKESIDDLLVIYRRIGESLLAYYRHRAYLHNFKKMLELLDDLSQTDSKDDFLPFEIIKSGKSLLRVNGKTTEYNGPILKQKKADFFFTNSNNFNLFKWNEIIDAQHRLWMNGFAFQSMGEILGPKNWAVLNGRLYIADTSSLTNNYEKGFLALGEKEMNKKERKVFAQLKAKPCLSFADDYFRFIRKEINQVKFQELWNTTFEQK